MLYDLRLWPSALEPCMAYFSEGLRLRVGGAFAQEVFSLAWRYALRFEVVALGLEPCMVYFSEGLRLRVGAFHLGSLQFSVEICFTI